MRKLWVKAWITLDGVFDAAYPTIDILRFQATMDMLNMRRTGAHQIAAPNVGGRPLFAIWTSLAARVGELGRYVAMVGRRRQ